LLSSHISAQGKHKDKLGFLIEGGSVHTEMYIIIDNVIHV